MDQSQRENGPMSAPGALAAVCVCARARERRQRQVHSRTIFPTITPTPAVLHSTILDHTHKTESTRLEAGKPALFHKPKP